MSIVLDEYETLLCKLSVLQEPPLAARPPNVLTNALANDGRSVSTVHNWCDQHKKRRMWSWLPGQTLYAQAADKNLQLAESRNMRSP